MTELLILILVGAAYLLGKARDERDRLLLILAERRAAACRERDHWQPIEDQLRAERQVWRATAAVRAAARQAMRDVADQSTRAEPAAAAPSTSVARAGQRHQARQRAAMRPMGLSAEEVQRTVNRSRQ